MNAYLWINNFPLPAEVCEREPLLKDYGFHRRLNTGNFEFLSVCDERTREFYEMHKDDLAKLIGKDEAKSYDASEAAIRILDREIPSGQD